MGNGRQISFGRATRRQELARKLYPSVLIACAQKDNKHRDEILQSFAKVDVSVAQDLAKELRASTTQSEANDSADVDFLKKPLLESAEGGQETVRELQRMENLGKDYDVGMILYGSGS